MFGTISLTRRQADLLENYRDGKSDNDYIRAANSDSSSLHHYKKALRKKGVLSHGKQGVKGSTQPLIEITDYVISDDGPGFWYDILTPHVKQLAVELASDYSADGLLALADAMEEAGYGNHWATKVLRTARPEPQTFNEMYPHPPYSDRVATQEHYRLHQERYMAYECPRARWDRQVKRIITCLASFGS